MDMWKVAALSHTTPSPTDAIALRGASHNAEPAIPQLRNAHNRASQARGAGHSAFSAMGSSKSFLTAGPAAKLAMLREANIPSRRTNKFFRTASQLNTLSSSVSSFKSLASAIRHFCSFCEITGAPFPHYRENGTGAELHFHIRPTFYNYANRLRNACFFH